jgi:hypothetical protein
MKTALSIATVLFLTGTLSFAHRLDEYLQGTILEVARDRVSAQITLTPGVAVFPSVTANIDTNADGVISDAEQRSYSERVLRELLIAIDGHPLTPHFLSAQFPTMEEMKEGRGEMRIEFDAALPPGGSNRKLTFENHHQSPIAAYQVNSLVPHDPDIRILSQNRNYSQSFYELNFVQKGTRFKEPLGIVGLLMFACLAFALRRNQSSVVHRS